MRRIGGLLQHAPVEGEPRQLAIEIAAERLGGGKSLLFFHGCRGRWVIHVARPGFSLVSSIRLPSRPPSPSEPSFGGGGTTSPGRARLPPEVLRHSYVRSGAPEIRRLQAG